MDSSAHFPTYFQQPWLTCPGPAPRPWSCPKSSYLQDARRANWRTCGPARWENIKRKVEADERIEAKAIRVISAYAATLQIIKIRR